MSGKGVFSLSRLSLSSHSLRPLSSSSSHSLCFVSLYPFGTCPSSSSHFFSSKISQTHFNSRQSSLPFSIREYSIRPRIRRERDDDGVDGDGEGRDHNSLKRRIALLVGYTGTNYYGLQYQQDPRFPSTPLSSSFKFILSFIITTLPHLSYLGIPAFFQCNNFIFLHPAIEAELLRAIDKAGLILPTNRS